MQLRLSFVDGLRVRTVSVRAPRGSTWATLAPALGLACRDRLVVEYAGRTEALRPHAVLGSPPLVHGVTIRPGELDERLGPEAPVSVLVTSGPDAGAAHRLRPGSHVTFGRDPWVDVVVHDPGLSRHHATLSTTRAGIVVEDAASTNGTRLGETVLDEPTVWPPSVPLRLGSTVLELAPDAAAVSRAVPDGEGYLVVPPRDRQPPPIEPVAWKLPSLITPTPPTPPAVLGWLLPVLVSVLLAVALRMPALMLFGLMAPAMSLGGYHGERRRHRRECARTRQDHARQVSQVRRTVLKAVSDEAHTRAERVPDLARLLRAAASTSDLLWSRSHDTVLCRLGLGVQATMVSLDGDLQAGVGIPIEVDLSGGLALVGVPEAVHALARNVLVQLAVLHAPSRLRMRAREAGPAWDWLAWLPHTREESPARETTATITLHDLTGSGQHGVGHPPISCAASAPAGRDAGSALVRDIPLVLCEEESQVPDLATVVRVSGTQLQVQTADVVIAGTPDLLSRPRAVRAARLLAALADRSGGAATSAVPETVPFSAVAPTTITGAEVTDLWRAEPRATRFPLGQDAEGAVTLDLVADGPHALVAGTTGSGKSELLRTLIASLALVNRPDELVLVLVDYKGGSAFADATALPHVVGMVTDLDPHLADRALTSLTAELRRRERILAHAGVPDLPAYQALSGLAPLPRLVLVIDEFRALAEELPDFLEGLVRIAALGRSLGVHLVLATQRPGGVVSADVRANVNLRIALRVRDSSDSYDVLDSPAAAQLPEGVPGRALVRTGSSPPRELQVASVTLPATPSEDVRHLSISTVSDLWATDRHAVPETNSTDIPDGQSTLVRVVAATTEAATFVGAHAPSSPWLPPLPETLSLAGLSGHTDPPAEGEGEHTAYALPLLLTDLPTQQAQAVHVWQPLLEGHLGIVGAGRTGRTTLVRTALAGLVAHHPDDVHIYAFDMGASIGPIGDAPHVGAVLGPADVARGARVIGHLITLVEARQRDLAARGHTSLSEQRASGDQPWPLVVLVIDGWARFAEVFGEADRGRPFDQVTQLLREGLAVGVVALLTGDRTLLGGRIAPLVPQLWALRLTDPSDLLLAGLTRGQVPSRMPPGRVVRLRDGVVGQVATVGASAEGADQVTALDRLVRASLDHSASVPPRRFRPLPRTITLSELAGRGPLPAGLLVGAGGDGADPRVIPVGPGGPGAIAVLGPPGSGRTTTLRTLETAAGQRGWVVVSVADEHLHDPALLADALHAASSEERGVLVTTELEDLAGTQTEDALMAWLAQAGVRPAAGPASPSRLLACAGGTDSFGGFRGLGQRVARERTGIVLQPVSPHDGSALGFNVPCGDLPLPGRGVLVLRGETSPIQVAHPGS
ncbi:FtsK/SpoIIIE domain-containing protein [Ornithinimicrobium cryptoxanthini]|uniref:FtsK/SpoIIIE domain-containing protein n=1 Tax=Ornithinimicrobium cryptoxanthini TaxID=2934161 RepID=A0ABY4YGI0_9MICO|nr:FtsK/SpoIIIE domain-containing protein [Ornithinimicrobium cryptoxanthini]USQ75365.1 FtsK/SpoIIIE domain-containing protein [Ornithinimicrobium cryptoxanthini]